MIGLYVHLPFCLRKCPYCGFFSEAGRESVMEAYVKRILKEAVSYPSMAVDTIYFGGGTPTLLPVSLLITLLDGIQKHFPCPNGEITLEANPATITMDSLSRLYEAGFNRLSIGIQSLSDRTLQVLGRPYSAKDAVSIVYDAKKAGFQNISGDIIYATPDETEAELAETLKGICDLPLTHISAYSLSIEPGTPFSKQELNLPDEDMERNMYWQVADTLSANGFHHYEISNFAREGFSAIHNTLYWKGASYIGLGAGAHSFFENVRHANVENIDAYITLQNPVASSVFIDRKERQEEYYMLGLRMLDGIKKTDNVHIEKLVKDGLLWDHNGKIGLTRHGVDIANYVICALCE